MSHDEKVVGDLIRAAVRRAWLLALIETAAWASMAGDLAFVVTSRSLAAVAAAVVVSAVLAIRSRRRISAARIVRALERADQQLRNVLVTAEELSSGALHASDAARDRVFAEAAVLTRRIDLAACLRWRRPALVLAIATLAVSTAGVIRSLRAPRLVLRAIGTRAGTPAIAAFHFNVRVVPPAYTRLPAVTLDDPSQLDVVEGSDVTITSADDGRRVLAHETALKTDVLVFDAPSGGHRAIPLVVTPDALPAVTITAPGRDLVYAAGAGRVVFAAQATDDFGLTSLTLHYTKVSGSGEQFAFEDGEIPLRVTRDSARAWRGDATRALGELRLADGDMLVYRAVASDARPGGGVASSDAFFIEISRTGVAAGEAFTLPEQETRYALSQQMLIVKTERLQQQRASMPADALRDAAVNLAVEQRMIRAEFVFMIGGEVEDEEVEAARSTELQEGRLENRGQRDLRTATIAMSQAEKLLTAVDLGGALAAEHAAVDALQRAFARGRYILRALASRANLEAARRLTGDLSTARDWRRTIPPTPENKRAALLQDALRGVADLAAVPPAAAGGGFDARARVLAETVLRIDVWSAPLREASASLQQAADARDAGARHHALTAAAAAVAGEARRSGAAPVIDVNAPGGVLAGAFADALANPR